MTEIPLPSFETFTKISGWLSEQANVRLSIVRNTKSFFSDIDMSIPATLGSSVQFLFFMIAVMGIVTFPIETLMWHVKPFDAAATISSLVFLLMSITIFSFAVFLFSKSLRGKGTALATFTSMFYATAFMPLIYILHYVDRINPAFREVIINDRLFDPTAMSQFSLTWLVAVTLIQLPVVIYVIIKLVGIVRVVHLFGSFRAILVICLAGITEQIYEYFIWIPLFAEMVRDFPA